MVCDPLQGCSKKAAGQQRAWPRGAFSENWFA